MLTQILQAIIYLAICTVVVLVGWEEPLRYRFLSPAEITAIENPASVPVASQLPKASQWRPMGTSLDRAPYETKNDGIEYTENIDMRQMGTRSEQDRRTNIFNGRGAQ